MSYILDALRRADAERERGAVPGLHSQTFAAGDDPPEARGLPGWGWVLLGLCALVVAIMVWLWLGRDSRPEPSVAAAPLPVTDAVAALPVAPPPAVPAVPTALPTAPARPAQPGADRSAPVSEPASATHTTHARKAPPAASASAADRLAARAIPPKAAGSAPAGKPAAPDGQAELRAPPLSALPANLRSELPALVVGGSVYAKTPANRVLILNGQPFHEGDAPMTELVIEQIKLKSAVLSYKGQRFELSY